MKKSLLVFTTVLMCSMVQAQTLPNPQNAQTLIQSTPTQNITIRDSQMVETNRKAHEWNLQPDEWQRYQDLMNGPLGVYSPGLDPLTALGISARNDDERRKYAEMQVMAETRRVERELAYQKAYDDAFKRLYPHLLPIVFPGGQTDLVPPSSTRLAVFVRDNCAACDARVKQLELSGQSFDIYMVGSNQDDTQIRRWATKVDINPQKVFSREITLNHDAGQWQGMNIGGDLPAVVRKVGGTWQRQ